MYKKTGLAGCSLSTAEIAAVVFAVVGAAAFVVAAFVATGAAGFLAAGAAAGSVFAAFAGAGAADFLAAGCSTVDFAFGWYPNTVHPRPVIVTSDRMTPKETAARRFGSDLNIFNDL
jgi:hypothetical protein